MAYCNCSQGVGNLYSRATERVHLALVPQLYQHLREPQLHAYQHLLLQALATLALLASVPTVQSFHSFGCHRIQSEGSIRESRWVIEDRSVPTRRSSIHVLLYYMYY